jgi:hypothetical protein
LPANNANNANVRASFIRVIGVIRGQNLFRVFRELRGQNPFPFFAVSLRGEVPCYLFASFSLYTRRTPQEWRSTTSLRKRAFERRFFLATAILFAITAFVGFAPTYYLKGFFNTPPIRGWSFTCTPFDEPVDHTLRRAGYFIRSTRIKNCTSNSGFFSVLLAAGIFVTGLVTGVAAAKYGSSTMPPGVEAARVSGRSVLRRHRVCGSLCRSRLLSTQCAESQGLMLYRTDFLPQLWRGSRSGSSKHMAHCGSLAFPAALAIIFLAVDTWRNRKLNIVFLCRDGLPHRISMAATFRSRQPRRGQFCDVAYRNGLILRVLSVEVFNERRREVGVFVYDNTPSGNFAWSTKRSTPRALTYASSASEDATTGSDP